MPHFYIDSSIGVATGDAGRFASAQTGPFTAATSYPTEAAALAATTPPAAGDTMYFSDNHNFDSGSVAISNNAGNISPPITQICADNANRDAYRTSQAARGKEATTSGTAADVSLVGARVVYGMEYSSVDNIVLRNDGGKNSFNDCKFNLLNASAILQIQGQLPTLIVDSEIALDSTSAFIFITGGTSLMVRGGEVTTITAGVSNLFSAGFTASGARVEFAGTDLSAVTGTLIGNVGGTITSDDQINAHFDLCKLASGVSRANEVFTSSGQRVLTTRCSSSSAAVEYQYGLTALGGDIDDDSAIFRNEDPAFADSGAKISYQIVTNSDASINTPLWFDMPNNRFAELSIGASDTLRFFVTTNTALTDKDIWVQVSYSDVTNKQTANHKGSAPSAAWTTVINPLASPTTLAVDGVSTWTGGLTNKYQIDIDTSGNAGADCVPIVRIFIAKPSVTIQISSIYELV